MPNQKILIIDDEAGILGAVNRTLRREDLTLFTTSSPDEALERISAEKFAVAISDQRMPEIEGSRFLEKVRELSPDTIRIILTGHADIESAVDAINRGSVFRFLTKPWVDDELCSVVRQAVAQYELVIENRRLNELTAVQNLELKDLNQNLETKVIERTSEVTRLNEQLQESFLCSVRTMAGLAELHSSVVGSHSKRVAAFSKEVATLMGMSSDDIFQVEVAATLHDIGKISVSADILSKSPEHHKKSEREVLQRHPVLGESIVRMVPAMVKASLFVRHHHELCDGSGYPDRLMKERIPLGAQIIGAVDAYDRMLNSMSAYETATPERALDYVLEQCPSHFRADVVEAIARSLREGDSLGVGSNEVEIGMKDLRPKMMLSRDLTTGRGVLLLPKDSVFNSDNLNIIKKFHESDPIVDGIFVYRRRPK